MIQIDEGAILKKVEDARQRPQVKKRIERKMNIHAQTGEKLESGDYVVGPAIAGRLARTLVSMIRAELPEQIKEVGSAISCTKPVRLPNGGYSVDIKFDKSAIFRESLENDDSYFAEHNGFTGDGISNIVALFNNGVQAKGHVYGYWNGHRPTGSALAFSVHGDEDYAWVRSAKDREPLHFMQKVEQKFNAMFSQKYCVTIILGSDYTNFDPDD